MKKNIKRKILYLALGALATYLASQGLLPQEEKIKQNENPPKPGYYRVLKVIDGDTLAIEMSGKSETLRLIGINTPETVDPRKPVECFGKEASDKAKKLLTGQDIKVEKDPTQDERDKYNRLLVYVYKEDGLFFNKYMVEEGYAYEYTYNLPYEYQTEFKAAQVVAEQKKIGLWADGICNKTRL